MTQPTLLIRHAACLYPCEAPNEAPLTDAWVAVENNVISGLGPEPYEGPPAAREIDARNHLVLPGFVNLHHHYSQSLTRVVPAGQKGRSLDWLGCMYPLWQELDGEAMDAAARLTAAQLLMSGVTTSVDHAYFYPDGQRRPPGCRNQSRARDGVAPARHSRLRAAPRGGHRRTHRQHAWRLGNFDHRRTGRHPEGLRACAGGPPRLRSPYRWCVSESGRR